MAPQKREGCCIGLWITHRQPVQMIPAQHARILVLLDFIATIHEVRTGGQGA
ncbi:MAG: hypothetical protein RL013_2329 [Bacteroidota bacterium]